MDKNSWEISYDEFKAQVESLHELMVRTTTQFPVLEKIDVNVEDYLGMTFIEKIREIEYDQDWVIGDAVEEYVVAMRHNISFSTQPHRLRMVDDYTSNLLHMYRTHFNKAKLQYINDVVNSSQCFYEDFRGQPVAAMGNFNNTPLKYRNGLIQLLADENQITWLLKPKTSSNI